MQFKIYDDLLNSWKHLKSYNQIILQYKEMLLFAVLKRPDFHSKNTKTREGKFYIQCEYIRIYSRTEKDAKF